MNKRHKQVVDHTRLLELLEYNKDTGMFSWKVRRGCVSAGTQCTNVGSGGYYRIRVDKVLYSAHRLAWYYWYGIYPEEQVDHINRNRLDNSIGNLRLLSQDLNAKNCTLSSNNSSGYNGVWFDKRRDLWVAEIMVNYKKKFLGYFEHLQDAIDTRKIANTEYGFSETHGEANE